MDFKDKVKRLRNELNMTLEDVAKKVGVSAPTILRYESGEIKNIRRDKIKLLADALNTTPEYLMGWTEGDKNNDAKETKTVSYYDTNFETIPVLGNIRAGEMMVAEQNIVGYEVIPKKDINGSRYFGLKVTGDSMNNARINEGDIVIVREQSFVENGEIAVILVDGEDATIKRFYQTDNIITLMPDSINKEHKPRFINPKNVDVKILGKVIKFIGKV